MLDIHLDLEIDIFILFSETNPSSARVTFVKVVNAPGAGEEEELDGQQQLQLQQQQQQQQLLVQDSNGLGPSSVVQDQISAVTSSPPLAVRDGTGALGPVTSDEILEEEGAGGQGMGMTLVQQPLGAELQDEVGQEEDEGEYVPQDVVTLDLTGGSESQEQVPVAQEVPDATGKTHFKFVCNNI